MLYAIHYIDFDTCEPRVLFHAAASLEEAWSHCVPGGVASIVPAIDDTDDGSTQVLAPELRSDEDHAVQAVMDTFGDAPFALPSLPNARQASITFASQSTRQRKLLSGLDALPGQLDLVPDVDQA